MNGKSPDMMMSNAKQVQQLLHVNKNNCSLLVFLYLCRQYCQRRLRRLYKTMNFHHGSRHAFKSKKVTQDLLKDVK